MPHLTPCQMKNKNKMRRHLCHSRSYRSGALNKFIASKMSTWTACHEVIQEESGKGIHLNKDMLHKDV